MLNLYQKIKKMYTGRILTKRSDFAKKEVVIAALVELVDTLA